MRKFGVLLAITLSWQVFAFTPPTGYETWSAIAKQSFHANKVNPKYKLPWLPVRVCQQTVAAFGFLSDEYLLQTIRGPSGYATEWNSWRRWTGRAIHRDGLVASGMLDLKKALFGLPPDTYRVTYRFSLANPVEFGFRPGLLMIIHRDGLPDLNVFLMPQNGLDGFDDPKTNPFRPLTPWLDDPTKFSIRLLAKATFQRVVGNVFRQDVATMVTREPATPSDTEAPSEIGDTPRLFLKPLGRVREF